MGKQEKSALTFQGFASLLSGPQTKKMKVNLQSKLGMWKILLFQYLGAAVYWLQYSKRNHKSFLMKLQCAVLGRSGMTVLHLSLLPYLWKQNSHNWTLPLRMKDRRDSFSVLLCTSFYKGLVPSLQMMNNRFHYSASNIPVCDVFLSLQKYWNIIWRINSFSNLKAIMMFLVV